MRQILKNILSQALLVSLLGGIAFAQDLDLKANSTFDVEGKTHLHHHWSSLNRFAQAGRALIYPRYMEKLFISEKFFEHFSLSIKLPQLDSQLELPAFNVELPALGFNLSSPDANLVPTGFDKDSWGFKLDYQLSENLKISADYQKANHLQGGALSSYWQEQTFQTPHLEISHQLSQNQSLQLDLRYFEQDFQSALGPTTHDWSVGTQYQVRF